MFPPGEGPSPRVIPASVPLHTPSPSPAPSPAASSPADDMADIRAAHRAAMIAQMLKAQIERQEAELRRQQAEAEAAKRRAQEAARQAWEAQEAVKHAKSDADRQRAQAESDRKGAALDAAAADWQLKEKQAAFTKADLADAKAWQKDPGSTRTRPTQAAVVKAQGELDDAAQVKDLLDSRVTALDKEAAAAKAEATARPRNFIGPVSPQQVAQMDEPARLRAEANDAQAAFNQKLMAWDVKQKLKTLNDAKADLQKTGAPYVPYAAGSPQAKAADKVTAAQADYDDALARQNAVNLAADAAHKQLLALQADAKVKGAQKDLLAEQQQLKQCMVDSPATRALKTAQAKAQQAHFDADSAATKAQKGMLDYQIGAVDKQIDAARADLQSATHGQYGPYVPGTPAGNASARLTQLQSQRKQLQDARQGTLTSAATLKSQQLWATLSPDQQQDPKALWNLFSQGDNATTIAQPLLNQYYQQYGDDAHAMSGTYLDNMIGITLALKPQGVDPSQVKDPAQRDKILHGQALFTGADDQDKIGKVRDHLRDAAGEVGGDRNSPNVALLPVAWGAKDVGMTTGMLYRVDGPGGERFVDDQGKVYQDWSDYRHHNGLPPTDSKIVLPKDGHLKVGADGNVVSESGKASLETGWQTFTRHADPWVAGITIVGGLLTDAAGVFLLPFGVGEAMEVGGTAMIVGGVTYFTAESTVNLVGMAQHDQSLNPLTSSEARTNELMLASSVLTMGSMGAAVKAGRLAAAGRAGDEAAAASARSWAVGSKAVGYSAMAAGTAPMVEQSVYAAQHWDTMTDQQKSQYWHQMGAGAAQMFVNPVLRGGMIGAGRATGRANPNATILPRWMTGSKPAAAGAGARPPGVEPATETAELAPDALTEATTASGRLALDAGAERGGASDIVVAGDGGKPVTLPVVDRPAAGRPAVTGTSGGDPLVPPTATQRPASPAGLPGPAHVPGLHPHDTGSDAVTVSLDLQRSTSGSGTHAAGGTHGGAARGEGARPGDASRDGSDGDTTAAGDPAVRDPRREARERARDPRAQALSPLRENPPRAVVDAQGRVTLRGADGRPLGAGVRPADLRYTSAKTGEGMEVAPPARPEGGEPPIRAMTATDGQAGAGPTPWEQAVLVETAQHPAVRTELRQLIKETYPDTTQRTQDQLFEAMFGSGLRDNARHLLPMYGSRYAEVVSQRTLVEEGEPHWPGMQPLVEQAVGRLAAKGVKVDAWHWTPTQEPRPGWYQIRPTRPPRIDTPEHLANALERITPQSHRIAEGIRLGEKERRSGVGQTKEQGIYVHLLGEEDFNDVTPHTDGAPALAFARGRHLYLNKDRSDSFALLLDAVHEGTHALDHAARYDLGKGYAVHGADHELVESGVHEAGSTYREGELEARAYYHEIEFAQAMGLNAKNESLDPEVQALLGVDPKLQGTMAATHTMRDVNRHIGLKYPDAMAQRTRTNPGPKDPPPINYQRSTEPPPSGQEGARSGDTSSTSPASSPASRPRITVRGPDGRPLGGRVDPANLRYTSAKTEAQAQAAATEAAANTAITPAALATATTARVPAAVRATNVRFDDGGSAHRAGEAPPLVGGKRKQVRTLPARAEAYDQVRKGQAPGTLMRPTPEQTELLSSLRSDEAWRKGDTVRFIVSPHAPDEVFVNDGGTGLSQADHPVSYGKFEEAQQAAAADGGAWVYRVSGPGRLIEAALKDAVLDPKRIEGAMRVYDDGELFPAAAPNLHHEVPYVNPKLATARSGVLNAKKGRFWQEGFVDAGLKAWQVKNKMAERFGRASALPERLPPEQRPAVSEWARAIVGKSRRATREGDVHFHRLPYDRRLKLAIASMLDPKMSGDLSRIAFGAIPQGCGKGYYSAKDSWELTFKQAWKLDRRFARDFASLTPEQKARADVMITGKNPAEPGFKAYVDQLMAAHPGVFKGIGELTVHKEYVSAALGKERAKLSDESLKEVFEAADEHGLVLLVHNDWGHAPVGKDHLHTQGHDEYHYFDKLVDLASKYPNVRLVLAHTGWARYFKGNTEPGRVTVHGQERVMPEHVARMYAALDRAPNVHFDISWNDVGEAYVFNPQMGDALVDFVIEHPDRVLYGSDSVKPPNGAFYHHNKTVLEPLLDRIDERSPLAAWLLERGNYERLFNGADVDSVNVATTRLRTQGKDAEADALQAQVDAVRALQRDNREALIRQDPRLVAQLRQMRATDAGNPLLRMFDDIDLDTPLPHEAAAARTAAAARPDAQAGGLPAAALPSYDHLMQRPASSAVDRQYADTEQRIADDGKLVTTSTGDQRNEDKAAIVVAGAGLLATSGAAAAAEVHALSPAAANDADMSAFLLRSAAGLGRSLYGEWLRFAGESLFEEGHITPEKIDWYQGRIEQMARKTGLDEDRIAYIKQATEQFRVDIDHIQNAPLRPGESHADRFEAVSAAAGLWSIRIDGALGTQGSSLEATNPRTKLGQFIRLIMVATFAHNAAKNGIYFTDPGITFLQGVQHGAYLVADAALAVHSAMGFASGVNGFAPKGEHYAGSNWESRVKGIRRLQTYAMPLFSVASGALTLVDAMHGRIPEAATDALFTAGTAWSSRNEIRADRRTGYPKPWMAAAPTTLTMLAIAARVLFGYGDVKNPTPASASAQGPGQLPPWLATGLAPGADAQAARLARLPALPDAPHPRLPDETVTADSGERGRASLWGIADAHVATLLTPQEERAAEARGGHEAVVQAALSQLIQLNPQQAAQPGLLLDGARIDADRFNA